MSRGADRLLALPRWTDDGAAAYRPGLDRMTALLSALGHPERAFPAVHVAGTNGKGSTASLAAAVLTASGRRTGLHTSPHLVHVEERMRVDGAPAPAAWLDAAVERLPLDDVRPSFFEATVALALAYFADEGVDVAVVEVGLGGRLDATGVVRSAVSVVTHVGLDHTDLLGGTLPEIAREKAGIARPGVPLLHAVTGEPGSPGQAAGAAVEAEAARRGAPTEDIRTTCRAERLPDGRLALTTPVRDYGALRLALPGAHQAWNAALAVRAAEIAAPDLAPEAVEAGLAGVVRLAGLRGRGETHPSDSRVVLDVAHNADGWDAALAAVRVPPGGRLHAVVGVMADKDADALAARLAASGARVWPVALPGPRALPAEALAAVLAAADAAPPMSVEDALARARAEAGDADRILVTGSFVTVGEALQAMG